MPLDSVACALYIRLSTSSFGISRLVSITRSVTTQTATPRWCTRPWAWP